MLELHSFFENLCKVLFSISFILPHTFSFICENGAIEASWDKAYVLNRDGDRFLAHLHVLSQLPFLYHLKLGSIQPYGAVYS